MKIKNIELKNISTGLVFKDELGKDITAFGVCINALGFTKTNNPLLSYRLSLALLDKDEVELTSEEITHIKSVINSSDNYTPSVIGQILNHLE